MIKTLAGTSICTPRILCIKNKTHQQLKEAFRNKINILGPIMNDSKWITALAAADEGADEEADES